MPITNLMISTGYSNLYLSIMELGLPNIPLNGHGVNSLVNHQYILCYYKKKLLLFLGAVGAEVCVEACPGV